MRHAYRKDCVNSDKAHLSRLPDLTERVPQIQNPSKRGIMLIPLFESKEWNDGIVHHNGIGAVYARRSWILFSDAQDYGVEVKFYVEEKMLSEAAKIFRHNFVNDDDIIVFDGSAFEEHGGLTDNLGTMTGESKKCSIFTNRIFEEYDWVFMIDSDMFVMSKNRDRLSFFESYFQSMPDDQIATWTTNARYRQTSEPPHSTPITDGWCRDAAGQVTDASIDAWKTKLQAIVGDGLTDLMFDPNHWYLNVQNGLFAFPAKRFMSERWDVCQWFIETSYALLSDEAVFSTWAACGNPIADMQDTLPFEGLMFTAYSRAVDDLDRFYQLNASGTPFILHYGSPIIETHWREGIDAL